MGCPAAHHTVHYIACPQLASALFACVGWAPSPRDIVFAECSSPQLLNAIADAAWTLASGCGLMRPLHRSNTKRGLTTCSNLHFGMGISYGITDKLALRTLHGVSWGSLGYPGVSWDAIGVPRGILCPRIILGYPKVSWGILGFLCSCFLDFLIS